MFGKPVVWQSSWHVFKSAVRALSKRSGLVACFIAGQLVLLALLWWLSSGYIVFGGADVFLQWAGAIILSLYQLVFSMAVIHVVADRDPQPFSDLMVSKILPRLPAAIVLSVLLAIVVGMGSLLLVIPGILLYVYTSLALLVLVVEGASVGQAIRRSINYVRGWWWRVCARIVFAMGVAALLSLISLVPLMGMIVVFFASLLFAPILVAYMTLTYQELVEKKRLLDAAPMSLGGRFGVIIAGLVVLGVLVGSSIVSDVVMQESAARSFFPRKSLPTYLRLNDDGTVTEDILPQE